MKQELVESTIKLLKDEIENREVLVLNNSSLLQVRRCEVSISKVLVKYSPSNVYHIFLNAYNFGMLSFKSTDEKCSVDYDLLSKDEDEENQGYFTSHMPNLELNHLKYIFEKNSVNLLSYVIYTNICVKLF